MSTVLTHKVVYNLPLAAVLLFQRANTMGNIHVTEHAIR